MATRSVSFVIPTKNEGATIESVISTLRTELSRTGHSLVEIVVTDDSHDDTREKAKALGAVVISGGGKGLGHAMLCGLKRASEKNPDCIISVDSDGQVDISEIARFIGALDSEKADLVVGSRFLANDLVSYDYPLINRLGTKILSWMLRRITGLPLTDSHGGIRAMRPSVVQALELLGTHTYVQETIIDAHENGFKVIEIPSRWLKREHGQSRVVGSIPRYVFYTLPVLLLRTGQHVKYLFVTGSLVILTAFFEIIWVFWDVGFSTQKMLDRQSLLLFFLLLSLGANLFFFGVVLEFLVHLRRVRK